MLRYLKHHEIDFGLWDACVRESPNGMVYALSWYLHAVSPGWEGIVKETGGKYSAVMPLPVKRKFGITFIQQPILTQQLGVFSRESLSAAEWSQIASLIRENFWFVTRYNFNTGNEEVLTSGLPGFSNQLYATYHLELTKSYKSIFAGYNKGRKWDVNQAKRNSLTIRQTENLNQLFELFEANTAGKIKGFIGEGFTYKIIRELYAQTKANNAGELYEVADKDGEILAMALFPIFNKKIIYLLSTTAPKGREQRAVTFLLDFVINKYAESGYIFDFEAPQPADEPEKSIIAFYKSFGPEKAAFLSVSLDNLPQPLKWLKQTRMKLYRRFLK